MLVGAVKRFRTVSVLIWLAWISMIAFVMLLQTAFGGFPILDVGIVAGLLLMTFGWTRPTKRTAQAQVWIAAALIGYGLWVEFLYVDADWTSWQPWETSFPPWIPTFTGLLILALRLTSDWIASRSVAGER
jgi:hypothetical protein